MTVTTQLTSKSLKLQTILSSLIFWIGFTFFAVGVNSTTNPGEGATIGGWMMVIGIIWYLVNRFRIFWNHE